MKLATDLIAKPWGRTALPPGFPDTGDQRIGEVAHRAPDGAAMPVLVKHIFTSAPLSIQVHPGDALARRRGLAAGKTEAWLILDAEPGAVLGLGTTVPVDAAALRAAAHDGSIATLLAWHPAQPGDAFLVPAGTIHAIGAGLSLLEVQQNSDVTYRLFDYGRPRPLQLEEGIEAAAGQPYPAALRRRAAGSETLLAETPWFTLRWLAGPARRQVGRTGRGDLLCPLAGLPLLDGVHVMPGRVHRLDTVADLALGPGDSTVLVEIGAA